MKCSFFITLLLSINILTTHSSACDDLELKDKAFKLSTHWNYALYANVQVQENFILVDSEKSPVRLSYNWKKYPYKLNVLIDVIKSSISNEGKVFVIKFFGKNTKSNKSKVVTKVVQIKKGKAKAKFYAPLSGISMTFKFTDFSISEWEDLDECPVYLTSALL